MIIVPNGGRKAVMKRRGFLGALAGAVAAGPSAAKEAARSSISGSNLLSAGNLASYGLAQGNPGLGYGAIDTASRISKLKRLISGEEQEQENPYAMCQIRQIKAEDAVSSLVSVARGQKISILRRRLAVLEKERDRAHWLLELVGLESNR